MDSQADSLDIANLKRFALGGDENDLSQTPFISEAESQPSLPGQISHDERVFHRILPRANHIQSGIAVRVPPEPTRYVNDTSQRNLQSQEPPSSVPNSITLKMSSGESGPGDTQPISQSIYEDIISRAKSFRPSQEGGTDAPGADQESLHMTVREGESGHIDLLDGFESKRTAIAYASSDDDGLSSRGGPSSPMQVAMHDVFPESQRFMETPVTSEKQRGAAPNLATTTPSLPRNPLAADLGSSGGTMALSLSQLFKATQSASSPFVNGLPPAPLSDRPSPDIPIQTRPLETYMSSPSRTSRRPHLTQTRTEPLPYIPMDESQKLRDKLSEEKRARSAENIDSEEPFDPDFDKESSFVERRNRQRQIDNETSVRLATVTHAQSPSDLEAKSSAELVKHQSQDETHDTQGASASSNNEGVSEEETEKEDNTEAPASQTRQFVSSSEEDKENFAGPYTTIAHDRLSQALDVHNDPSLTDTPAVPSASTPENNLVKDSEQVINVRDSQPSPSQGTPKKGRTAGLTPQPELEQIHSSHGDSPPPTKRQRQRYHSEPEASLSPIIQPVQRNFQLFSSVRSPNHSHRHQASSNDQQILIQNVHGGTSSMPSLVANTPLNKIGDDTIPGTIPGTSIPESSPGRIRQANTMVEAPNPLPTMQETDQEDFDLPTPRHRRQLGSFVRVSSHRATSRASSDRQPLKKFFNSSSPAKGIIKTLSEISAEQSPQAAPGEDLFNFDILNNEDREFSKAVASPSRRTPRKRLRLGDYRGSSQIGSSPLALPEPSHAVDTVHAAHLESQDNGPGSPETPFRPVIARRQHGWPSRRSESIFDMDGSPRVRTPATTLRMSKDKQPGRKFRKLTTPEVTIYSSSQRSVHSTSADFVQTEPMVPDESVSSSRDLSNLNIHAENATSDIDSPVPEDAIVAPKQVLAFWPGRKRAYYPATYLHSCGSQRCKVKFVDSEPVEVPIGRVKKLQLRVGDAIKVDLPNVPKVTHIVQGFSQKLEGEELLKKDDDGYVPMTDIYGFSNVILTAKKSKGGDEETIQVPIYSIYLDMTLWNRMAGRAFTPDIKTEAKPNFIKTPSRGGSTPVSPGSKLSRSLLTAPVGVFSGMVFVTSFGDQDTTKAEITKLIFENGGQVLEDGFEELFEFPSNLPPVTQTPCTSDNEQPVHFRLASGCENIGFTCLIADEHSRRVKYMQALALNLPCLSRKWVEDCVSQNRILSWEHYLLPAGQSEYLNGAIKSRVLTPVSAETATLSQMIDGRAKLLDGQSLLLVLGQRGGKTEGRRKAYLFLAYALGAVRVGRVLDLKTGKEMLRENAQNNAGEHGWDWLYVEDRDEATTEELTVAKPDGVADGSRKRKRSRSSVRAKSFGEEKEVSIQVMSNEFVCQSLILGKICK